MPDTTPPPPATLNAVELAAVLGASIGPQSEGTTCYTCGSELRTDGVCLYCTQHIAFLQMKKGVRTLFEEGQVVEVRALPKDNTESVQSGYFTDRLKLAKAIRSLEESAEFKAVYFTLNPVLLDRVRGANLNTLSAAHRTTRDADIACRRWMLIDLDPVRASGTSSTEEELNAAIHVMLQVREYLQERGWPEPVIAASGNGYHLLVRLADLPNDDASTDAINAALRHLSARFSTPEVNLDTAVGNASRICKAYGSTSRKGTDTATRPWRGSYLRSIPSSIVPLTLEQLQALVPPTSEPEPRDKPGMHEDFDIEQFAEFYDLSLMNPAGELKDGRLYFYLDECPLAGRRHSGDPRKSALVLGDVLGYKCFSDECDGKGIGDLLRHFSSELDYKPYPHPLFAEREEIEVFGDGEDASWTPVEPSTPKVVATTEDDGEKEDESGEEPQQTLVQETVLAPVTTVAQPTDDLYGFEQLAPKPSIEHPARYVGQADRTAIPIPQGAMYGWLAEKAKTLQAPMGWAYPALMTTFAAQGINLDAAQWDTRPTLFTTLLGRVGDGKSRTIDRAEHTLMSLPREQIKRTIPGSDRGLMSMFAPPKRAKGDPPVEQELKAWLLTQDEFKTLLNKMAIQNSSLATTLCTAFYKDEFGASDKVGEVVVSARINLLGGLKCESSEEFEKLFGVATTGGLYDRFVYGVGCTGWKWEPKWHPTPEHRRAIDVEIGAEAMNLWCAWRDEEITDEEGNIHPKHKGRLAEIAQRVALISSSANHEPIVSVHCMRAALYFAEWQEAIRREYVAGEAESKDAECTSAILRKVNSVGVGRETDGSAKWFSWNRMYKNTSWNRTFGPDLCRRMRYALVEMGTLEEEKTETDSDSKKKQPAPKATGRYRLMD